MQANTTISIPSNRTLDLKKKSSPPFWKSLIVHHLEKVEGNRIILEDSSGQIVFGQNGNLNCKIQVFDQSVYKSMILGGTMAIAETYMEGKWTCDNLYSLFRVFSKRRDLVELLDGPWTKATRMLLRLSERRFKNTKKGSKENIAKHYDLGNDFFQLFLDPTMTYSSALFENETMDLATASTAKLDRICKVLNIQPGDNVVEIGGGWGSFAIHAASNYKCNIVFLTLSVEQKKFAEERIKKYGLEKQIKILLEDYRNMKGRFQHLVSIEMIEAVGPQFYGEYFKKCNELLENGGKAMIQAITIPDQSYEAHLSNVDFIQKYVFPGSKIPCVSILLKEARNNSSLVLNDLKDMSIDYAKTMCLWRENFIKNLSRAQELGYSTSFLRMWDYYLNYCAAGFNERYLGVSQLMFRKF